MNLLASLKNSYILVHLGPQGAPTQRILEPSLGSQFSVAGTVELLPCVRGVVGRGDSAEIQVDKPGLCFQGPSVSRRDRHEMAVTG